VSNRELSEIRLERVLVTPGIKLHCELISFIIIMSDCGSRDSSVGMATGYRLNYEGAVVRVPVG
jgi:hypothetical protein